MTHSRMVPDHLPPVRNAGPDEVETVSLDTVAVKSHIGGLIRSSERKVA